MDPNELLKLLGLGAKPARPPDGATRTAATDPATPESTGPKSPTALEVDEWGLRRGRDLVAESERVRKTGADAFAAADVFAAAKEDNELLVLPAAVLAEVEGGTDEAVTLDRQSKLCGVVRWHGGPSPGCYPSN